MLFKTIFFRSNLILILTLTLFGAALADTIRLKDGSVIKGKIVNFGAGKFTVIIDDGTRKRQLDYNAGDVESISFDAANAAAALPSTINPNRDPLQPPQKIDLPNQNQRATTTAPVVVASAPATTATTATTVSNPKPITINVSVLADNTSNGWTNSGFVVQKGQRVRITSSGRVSLGGGRYTTPEGIATLPDTSKLMAKEATGALIAVVGDDNNDFILIGTGREFTATRDGALFFGVNEGNLDDNSGLFSVRLDIYPNR